MVKNKFCPWNQPLQLNVEEQDGWDIEASVFLRDWLYSGGGKLSVWCTYVHRVPNMVVHPYWVQQFWGCALECQIESTNIICHLNFIVQPISNFQSKVILCLVVYTNVIYLRLDDRLVSK